MPFQTPTGQPTPTVVEVPREPPPYKRPLITPIGGGELVPYTRASTFSDALTDTFQLSQWGQRMVALGLARRPDLLTAVAASHDDRAALNELCEQAREAAGGTAAATMGTAIHRLTEIVDRGEPLPETTPPAAAERVRLYQATMSDARLEHVLIETFIVNDELRAAGTFDRLVRAPSGATLIADIKTGANLYPLEMSVQLAVYASGKRYDPATGQRSPLDEDLDPTRGIIVHLPAEGGPCRLYELDLAEGSRRAAVAALTRQSRSTRGLMKLRFTRTPKEN